MGASGAIIMGAFGTVFAAAASWRHGWPWPVLAMILLPFAALAAGARALRRLPGPPLRPDARTRRALRWSSAGEGVALFLAGNLLARLGRPDLMLPTVALVVGLHFVPIALAARLPALGGLAALLVAAAVAGYLVGPPPGGALAGWTAAFGLWAAAALALRRDWRHRLLAVGPGPGRIG